MDQTLPAVTQDRTTPFQWSILFGTALILIGLDQIAKALVVRNLELYETWVPVPAFKDFFDITYTQNTGAAFGMLPSASVVFLLIAIIASAVIIYYYREVKGDAWFLRMTMGLMMGGAIGNAIDRLTRGFVVDFLHVFYDPLGFDYPIFNFADAAIVIGVLLLLLLRKYEQDQATSPD
jgi:signal peptidase II